MPAEAGPADRSDGARGVADRVSEARLWQRHMEMAKLGAIANDGVNRQTLGLDGTETFDVTGLADGLSPRMELTLTIHRADGSKDEVPLLCRIDTLDEVEYYKSGGILQYVLKNLKDAA